LNYSIEPFKDAYKDQLLSVWDSSVVTTHLFLRILDYIEIKKLVNEIDFNQFQVYCLMQDENVLGFVGVADHKVEMLFLKPQFFKKGLGRKLMDFAIHELKVNKVDVNEQNTKAVIFYEKMGFVTYERSEKDDQGRDYPLLRMRLKPEQSL
jgi:putative acetyltransferase